MISENNKAIIEKVSELFDKAKNVVFFTGAGISVESGIAPFRGNNGVWTKYDAKVLELNYYLKNPSKCWPVIKELFYSKKVIDATPNSAHYAIAEYERQGKSLAVITQNIDNLHQKAGSKKVVELHGNISRFYCQKCSKQWFSNDVVLDDDKPICKDCGGLLKPDFVFFSEPLSSKSLEDAYEFSMKADLFVIIGSSGEVQPANQFPLLAKQSKATIIEFNTDESNYTKYITDYFIKGKVGRTLPMLLKYKGEL